MSTSAKRQGYYGWTIVFCAFVVVFLSFSIRGAFSAFLTPMTKELDWSTSTVSAGYSIFICVYGVTAFFAGAMMDRFGPKPVFIVHGCLLGLGLFLSSFSRFPWQYYLTYGVLSGIGAGALFSPPMALVRKWFIKGLGRATGTATAACGLGFGLAPIAAMYLIKGLSWHDAMRILGVILAVGVVLVALLTKPNPESIGLHPPGWEEAQAAAKDNAAGADYSFTLAGAFRTATFWLLIIAYIFQNFSEFVFQSQSLNYATTELGFERVTSTYIYALAGLVYMCIGPIIGIVIDRLTVKFSNNAFKARKLALAVEYTVAILAGIYSLFIRTPAMYAVYTCLFGLTCGTYIPTIVGQFGECFGRKYSGRILGVATLFGQGIGGALGPFLAGYLRDMTGNYHLSFTVGTITYACALVLTQLARKPQQKPTGITN
ncbi:MAG: MFS transporter [Actinomycetes bacterium]|jgi:MFS family permease|nr:MFS transporter [Actinomycetes bacterium]